jgi:hypothetical protein
LVRPVAHVLLTTEYAPVIVVDDITAFAPAI